MKRSELKVGQHYRLEDTLFWKYVQISATHHMLTETSGAEPEKKVGLVREYTWSIDPEVVIIPPIPIPLDAICCDILENGAKKLKNRRGY